MLRKERMLAANDVRGHDPGVTVVGYCPHDLDTVPNGKLNCRTRSRKKVLGKGAALTSHRGIRRELDFSLLHVQILQESTATVNNFRHKKLKIIRGWPARPQFLYPACIQRFAYISFLCLLSYCCSTLYSNIPRVVSCCAIVCYGVSMSTVWLFMYAVA